VSKLVALAVVSTLLAACGSSSSGSAAAPPTTPLAGKIGGTPFTPTAVQAINVGTGTTACATSQGDLGLHAVELAITSYASGADACGDLHSGLCRFRAGARKVTVIVVKGQGGVSPAEPSLTAGDYDVTTDIQRPTIEDATTGRFHVAYAEALDLDPSCAGTAHPSIGGTVHLDAVPTTGTGPITGHLTITFDDGSDLAGSFSAPVCGGQAPDICGAVQAHLLCAPAPACP
jgi:hypothetical protein